MASNQPEGPATHKVHVSHTCYLCSAPAHHQCERCHRSICAAHTVTFPHESWQQFSNGREAWQRYLPDPGADPWHMCPACSMVIQRHDKQEEARDSRNLWKLRIGFVLVIAATVIFFYWLSH